MSIACKFVKNILVNNFQSVNINIYIYYKYFIDSIFNC